MNCQDEGKEITSIGFYRGGECIAALSGNLPHWRQNAVTYFVTFRMNDSMPQNKIEQWIADKEEWLRKHPEPWDKEVACEYCKLVMDKWEYWLDQGYGACSLKLNPLRDIVEDAIFRFDGERYTLDLFVVAANHVHVLVTPIEGYELSEVLQSWKSFTSKQINRRLRRTGAFWQKESFDHIVRNCGQLERIRQYIKMHQVRAKEE